MTSTMYSSLRPVFTLRRGHSLANTHSCSLRPFSSSVLRAEDASLDKSQTRGIPLAFDLGGINISKRTQQQTPRIALSKRLGAKLQSASHADTTPITRAAQHRVGRARTQVTLQRQTRPSALYVKKPTQGNLKSATPSAGLRDNARASSVKQTENRIGVKSGPGEANTHQRTGQNRGRNRANASSGTAPRRKKKQIKQKATGRNQDSSKRNAVNEEYIEGSRNFDERGLIKIKEPGVVPKLQVLQTAPLESVFGIVKGSSTSTLYSHGTLQLRPYVHHSPPGDTGHGILGVVDTAQLALSRVRDLDVPRRREALDIVSKLATAVKSTGVEKRA